MKGLKFIIIALTAGLFAFNTAKSQSIVYKDMMWYWHRPNKIYTTTQTHEVNAPSGTISIVLFFQLDTDDPLVPKKGVVRINGEVWDTLIHSDGFAVCTYHLNGKLLHH